MLLWKFNGLSHYLEESEITIYSCMMHTGRRKLQPSVPTVCYITVQKNNCSVCRYLKHIASICGCLFEIEDRVSTEQVRIRHVFQIEKRACFLNSGIYHTVGTDGCNFPYRYTTGSCQKKWVCGKLAVQAYACG